MRQRLRIASIMLASWWQLAGQPLATDPQIAAGGVLHAARMTPTVLPGSSLAKGGLMVIRGQNLGPDEKVQAAPPYPTELPSDGTIVEISFAGMTSPIRAPIISTCSTEVRAVVPPQMPESEVQIRVSYVGRTSLPEPAKVVPVNFGVFTENELGSGPAVAMVLDASGVTRRIDLLNPARAGDTVVLRGTGLGRVSDDDTMLEFPLEGEMLVAGTRAPIASGGRAADLQGVDEIRFVMPDDVPDGCYVPVAMRQGKTYSNFVTIAKAGRGTHGGCAHPLGLTEPMLAGLSRGESITAGVLGFVGMSLDTPFGPVVMGSAGGVFSKFDSNSLFMARGLGVTALVDGACTFHAGPAQTGGTQILMPAPAGEGLNAGVLLVSGPEGQSWEVPRSANGGYNVTEASLAELTEYRPATPGRWSIQTEGGPDVRMFSASVEIPAPVQWLNKDALTAIDRSEDLKFLWNPEPGESTDLVLVSVMLISLPSNRAGRVQAQVTCAAEFNTGSVTIPAELLAQLPATSGDDVAIAILSNSPFDRRTQEFPAQLSDGSVLGNNRITSVVGQAKVVDLR